MISQKKYWQRLPAFRVLVFILSGIIISSFCCPVLTKNYLLFFLIICATVFFILRNRAYLPWLALFLLGFYADQDNRKSASNEIPDKETNLEVVATFDAPKFTKIQVKTQLTNGEKFGGLIYAPPSFKIVKGNLLKCDANWLPVFPDHNPGCFDYGQYLNKKGIYYCAFPDSIVVRTCNSSIQGWAQHLRLKATLVLKRNNINHGIVHALLLGDKSMLEEDTRNNFSSIGGMHFLAVSGFHVGIIVLLLNLMLAPLRLSKFPLTRLFLFLILMWLYALCTGLSASVVRAVLMFSILETGKYFKWPSNTANSLYATAFILLLFDSNYVFDIGFQLSFIATAGIIHLYPIIYNSFTFNSKILDWAWKLVAVSCAAQLATFPLSIYYFHVFPVYFLVSNFVLLPFVFVLLAIGIPLLILLVFFELPLCVRTFTTITDFLLNMVDHLAQLPGAILGPFYWELPLILGLYLVLGFIFIYYQTEKIKLVSAAMISLVFCLIFQINTQFKLQNWKGIVVFNSRRESILFFRKNGENNIITSSNKALNYYANFWQKWPVKTKISQIQRGVVAQFNNTVVLSDFNDFDYFKNAKEHVYIGNKKIIAQQLAGLPNGHTLVLKSLKQFENPLDLIELCSKRRISLYVIEQQGAFIKSL